MRLKQIPWLQFGMSETQSNYSCVVLMVERKNYFCAQRKFPIGIGKDIRKVAATEAKNISPYEGSFVSFWVAKQADEFVVTFWAYKPDIFAGAPDSQPFFLLPESFWHDINKGVSKVGFEAKHEDIRQQLKQSLLRSPVNTILAFQYTPSFKKLIKPFTRVFFIKWLAISMLIATSYLAIVSLSQLGMKKYVEATQEKSLPFVNEYFTIKSEVDRNIEVLNSQSLLNDDQNRISELILLLNSMKQGHDLRIQQLVFRRGQFDISMEAKNANNFMQSFIKNEQVSGLTIQGAVSKTKGAVKRDRFRIKFSWTSKVWK